MASRAGEVTRFPVRVVMSRTGLTADVLRAWERRYGAVKPYRSPAGQRLYSEQDVARLLLLRRATQGGHSIGAIAPLDNAALEALLEEPAATTAEPSAELQALVREALQATERMDAPALDGTLRRAAMVLGATAFVDELAPAFLVQVGARWHDGKISPAHEHLASSQMRRALDRVIEAFVVPARAPRLVVSTPTGELHELGAMLAAAAAAQEGWRVIYLGPNLPAADIARAARDARARAVALSVVAGSDRDVAREVRSTARGLPEGASLFVGGRAAAKVGSEVRVRGVRVLTDIAALRRALRNIRSLSESDAHVPAP